MRIGVLAVQGAFAEHIAVLRKLKAAALPVRLPLELISLNMKIIRLPEELMDYVILHELVHTRFKNHSNDFWAELNRLMGNGKGMALRLREYGLGLL